MIFPILLLLSVISIANGQQNYYVNCRSPTNVFSGKYCSASAPDIVFQDEPSYASSSASCAQRCNSAYSDSFAYQWTFNTNSCRCFRSASFQGNVNAGSTTSGGQGGSCNDCRHDYAPSIIFNGEVDIKTFEGATNGWNPLNIDVYGSKVILSARGFEGAYNYKSRAWLFDLSSQTPEVPIHTFADPDDLYNPNNMYYGETVFINDDFVVITSRFENKIYIFDASAPYALAHTIDGTSYGTEFPSKNAQLGNYLNVKFDKTTNTIFALGRTRGILTRYNGATWSVSVTPTYSESNTVYNIALADGARWVLYCIHSGGTTAACRIYNPSETGVLGSTVGTPSIYEDYRGNTIIVPDNVDVANTPDYVIFQDVTERKNLFFNSWQTTSTINPYADAPDLSCEASTTTAGGYRYAHYDSVSRRLLIGSTSVEYNGRCVAEMPTSVNGSPDILRYIDKTDTNAHTSFSEYGAIHDNTIVFVAPRTTSSPQNYVIGFVYAYDMIIPPPTVSPTLSPTPAPTFECTESIHCGDNEYCTTSNTCAQTSCTVSSDCDGLFKAGRIRHCGTGGFCEDLYPGTCSTDTHCASEIKKYVASINGVSKVTRTIVSDDPVVKVNTTKQLLQRLNAQKNENYTTVAIVKSEESGTIPQSVIDQAGGESAFITGIKNSMFDSELHDAVTVQVGGSRRVLQESTSVEISITYEIDDDAYDLITENGTICSGNFVNNLAAELGIGAGNITVTAIDGNLVIDIVLLESEEEDGVPLGDEIITEIQNIDSLLTSITSDLVSEIDGLDANDVESSAIDYCGDRTCSGRGDNTASNTNSVGCNINTGVCVCQEGYWGINCRTECNCLNGRVCVGGLCKCYYPEWGLRCENTKDCETCASS